jgi:hypothetical protein
MLGRDLMLRGEPLPAHVAGLGHGDDASPVRVLQRPAGVRVAAASGADDGEGDR